MQISNSMKPLNIGLDGVKWAKRDTFEHVGGLSEQEYTLEDALRKQYGNQFSIDATVDDIASGRYDSTNFRLPSFQQEDIDAYRATLEKNGSSSEIDWNRVHFDFSAKDISLSDIDVLTEKIDYVASRYAVLKDRILTNYSGNAQAEQLEKLNQTYSNTKNQMAKEYSSIVGGYFSENGLEGETKKLYDSVIAGIDGKSELYSAHLKENADYAQITDEKDKWLTNDDSYMAARLRESLASSAPAKSTAASADSNSSLYSLRDLEVAGAYVKQTTAQMESLSTPGLIRNEEALGLDLAVQAMKTDYLTKNSGISSDMASIINRSFQGFMSHYLDNLDDALELQSRTSATPNREQAYAPLNHSAVDTVYQYTMDQYQKSGNLMESLAAGAKFGKGIYATKVASAQNGGQERYQEAISYGWDRFFSNDNQRPYDSNLSDIEKYALTLNWFTDSVSSGKLNMVLGANGELSSDRIQYTNYMMYLRDGFWEARA